MSTPDPYYLGRVLAAVEAELARLATRAAFWRDLYIDDNCPTAENLAGLDAEALGRSIPSVTDFHPLTCVGCGTTDFDPSPGAEHDTVTVMSHARFWAMAGPPPGLCYAICNACYDRNIGVLWNDNGTLARVWFGDRPWDA